MLHATTIGTGSRVVLVHGFTQTGRSWSPIVSGLSSQYEVVTIDLPGHGASGPALDLWATADELVATVGPATYVGYSLGGRVALHAALAHPGAVERLVLLGATAGIDDPAERAERRAADEALAAALERDGLDAFLDRWLALPLFAGLPTEAAGLEERRTNTVAGLAGSLRLAGTATMDPPLWDRLASLTMPVLVLAGHHDHKFAALGRRLAAAIGANATFASIEQAGHAAHLEQPAALLTLLAAFLPR